MTNLQTVRALLRSDETDAEALAKTLADIRARAIEKIEAVIDEIAEDVLAYATTAKGKALVAGE
ncbi:MAG: hypothetical protein WDN31_02720 [Hyphomicrobium sp.]